MIFFSFFSGKVLKLVQAIFLAVRLLISFQVQFVSFAKRKATSTIEEQKLKSHEKRDRLLTSNMEFILTQSNLV